MAVTRFNRSQTIGKRLHWLLDLTYAGQTVRLSQDSLSIVSSEFGSVQYAGVLDDFNVPLSLDLFSDAASLLSISVSGVLPINVPKLVAQGHDFGAATGILYQWIEGTTYESRRIVMRGRVTNPEYSAEDEPVNFSLADNLYDDKGALIPATANVSFNTWGSDEPTSGLPYYFSLSDSEKGLDYPLIFGNPGKVSTALASSGWITGSQLVWVGHEKVADGANWTALKGILCGRRVTASYVYLNTKDYTSGYRFPVKHGVDDLGREIAYVDELADATYSNADAFGTYYGLGSNTVDGSFQPNSGEDKPVYVGWVDVTDAAAGGISGPNGETVRGAGDVIETVLSFSTMKIDRARIGAVKSLLNRFKIDAVVESGSVTPWDWIRANLLPILPVSVCKGPEGAYLVVWRYDATARDAVGHIDATNNPEIEVAESVKYDNSKVANSFSLKYALSLRTGNYQGLATLNEDNSYHCALSQRRYRVADEGPNSGVFVKEVESIVVYDDSTASAILAWQALAYAFARRTLELLVPEGEWAWLERGAIVLVTVPWLYLTSQLAIVEVIEGGGDGLLGLRLLLLEDPARDSRTVP